ncbi:MAG TPA: hypothetical protein PL041_13850 [Melioribacteraceae bacterium]|nr:hypothetical protein [Melioribacteraceae bacterium]
MTDNERYEAKELYVEEGLGINTIFGIFEGKFPLRILYKWRKEDNWDKERIIYRKNEIPLKEELYQLVKTAIAQAKLNPTPQQISAVSKVLWALLTAVKEIKSDIILDNSERKETINSTTIKKIEEEILGI